MNASSLENQFSEAEQRQLTERLYGLLRTQTEKYLAGESTSVAVETAQELFHSLLYTLRLALAETGRPERDLLTGDLNGLLRQGQTILRKKLADGKHLWKQVCLTAPRIQNSFYQMTLTDLGKFFSRYDLRYFAHQIPCSIEYPLCLPVSDEMQGISYVELWLRRLLTENLLLSRFPEPAVLDLLARVSANFRDYPLNLCEQPMVNAVGLALLEKPVFSLDVSAQDCARLKQILPVGKDMEAALDRAADSVAAQISAPKEAAEYLRKIAGGLRPRLAAALSVETLGGIFCLSQA